eukprot:scaffold67481_cov57-Phaeocystis_antarctica.AAC.7
MPRLARAHLWLVAPARLVASTDRTARPSATEGARRERQRRPIRRTSAGGGGDAAGRRHPRAGGRDPAARAHGVSSPQPVPPPVGALRDAPEQESHAAPPHVVARPGQLPDARGRRSPGAALLGLG